MSSRKHHIPSLDGLRAISITLVLFSHLLGTKHFPVPNHFVFSNLGSLGVRVFFVISGFLITGLLLRERQLTGKINLTEFYFRRTLRIFPVYYFYLFLVAGLTLIGILNIPWIEFLKPLTYTTNIFHTPEWMLGHSWSLSIEEQFYLLWPGLLVLFGLRPGFWLLCCAILVMPIARVLCFRLSPSSYALSYGIIGNLDSIAIGCALAMWRERLHSNTWYMKFLQSPLVCAAPVLLFLANASWNHPNIYYFAAISLCNLCIVVCLDWSITYPLSSVGKVLNSRPFVAVGLISYSLYLWQQPFLNRGSSAMICAFPLNIILAVAVAVFSYFIIEKKALNLRQKLDERWFGKKAPVPTATYSDCKK